MGIKSFRYLLLCSDILPHLGKYTLLFAIFGLECQHILTLHKGEFDIAKPAAKILMLYSFTAPGK